MAVSTSVVSVGTSATALTGTGRGPSRGTAIVTVDAEVALSVGGPGVTVASGIRIAANGVRAFEVAGGDTLFAIAATPGNARVLVGSRA